VGIAPRLVAAAAIFIGTGMEGVTLYRYRKQIARQPTAEEKRALADGEESVQLVTGALSQRPRTGQLIEEVGGLFVGWRRLFRR